MHPAASPEVSAPLVGSLPLPPDKKFGFHSFSDPVLIVCIFLFAPCDAPGSKLNAGILGLADVFKFNLLPELPELKQMMANWEDSPSK
jgi:hypothetical protein